MLRKVFRFFSKPWVLASFNLLLVLTLIAGNISWTVACNPSTWATIVLSCCFIATVAYPLVQHAKLSLLLSFVNGVSLFLYAYFIYFLLEMSAFGFLAIIVGIGLLAYIPHFLLGQLIRNYWVKPRSALNKKLFLTGLFASLLLMVYSGISYRVAASEIEAKIDQDFSNVSHNFMTEKIIGMHFIYHTRYCPYDGWRPPKHEPLLVMGLWLNGYSPLGYTRRGDPLGSFDLKKRMALYQQTFPEKPIKFDCACSWEDHWAYHSDEIWQE